MDTLELAAVRPDYWITLCLWVTAVIVLVATIPRLNARIRAVAAVTAVVITLRLLLLDNPYVWNFYLHHLEPGAVGWRQASLIEKVRDSYLSVTEPPRILAVGSSQTGAVFDSLAKASADLSTFTIAAMAPMDFVLYSKEIIRRRPETVILYLSDFDLAKRPAREALVLVPQNGTRIIPIAMRMLKLPEASVEKEARAALVEMLFGEILPELKFRFVFRSMADRQIARVANRFGRRDSRPSERAGVDQLIAWFREDLSSSHLPFNALWLEEFLEIMKREAISVVIVEGHYNPLAADERIERLNRDTFGLLTAISDRHLHVRFIPRTQILEFAADDYYDLTHVHAEAGERFARELLTRI
jgi:hypothetical protein